MWPTTMASQERRRVLAERVVPCVIKPIGVARLTDGVSHAAQRVQSAAVQADAGQGALDGTEPWFRVLVGERGHRLYVLNAERIDYVESQGNYVKLHSSGTEFISRDSVKRLAAVLAGSGFIRIERSLVVNVRAIQYVQRSGRGTYAFTLLSGSVLHSGARYRDEILRVLPLEQQH
jgi:DNA-binding LytR/AlgR family response regulator